jgi:hypothetical protein
MLANLASKIVIVVRHKGYLGLPSISVIRSFVVAHVLVPKLVEGHSLFMIVQNVGTFNKLVIESQPGLH